MEPKPDLQPGDRVMVFWETGKKKFWNAVVADVTASSSKEKVSSKQSKVVFFQFPHPRQIVSRRLLYLF